MDALLWADDPAPTALPWPRPPGLVLRVTQTHAPDGTAREPTVTTWEGRDRVTYRWAAETGAWREAARVPMR